MRQRRRIICVMGVILVISSLLFAPFLLAAESVDSDTSTTDLHYLVTMGDELFFSSDYDGASDYYRQALEHINSPVVLLRYAFALGETGRHDESLALYKEALDMDVSFRNTPKAVPGEERWDTEHWLERLGNPEEAIYYYTDALEEFPRSPTITLALAWAYSYLYNNERAIHYFKETIENDPLYIDAYANLGSTLYAEGEDPNAALHYLNVFLLLNPTGVGAENLREKRDDILGQQRR